MGFTGNLHCFHCSSLPEALCCCLASYSFPINAVVVGVGMHSFPLFRSPFLMACLRSVTLISKVHLVSPMYTSLQSLRGTWYTTSFVFSSGVFCFTLTSNCLQGLEMAFAPRGAQAVFNLSLRPHTKERSVGCRSSSDSCCSWSSCAGGVLEKVFFISFYGNSLGTNAFARCSLSLLVGWCCHRSSGLSQACIPSLLSAF